MRDLRSEPRFRFAEPPPHPEKIYLKGKPLCFVSIKHLVKLYILSKVSPHPERARLTSFACLPGGGNLVCTPYKPWIQYLGKVNKLCLFTGGNFCLLRLVWLSNLNKTRV